MRELLAEEEVVAAALLRSWRSSSMSKSTSRHRSPPAAFCLLRNCPMSCDGGSSRRSNRCCMAALDSSFQKSRLDSRDGWRGSTAASIFTMTSVGLEEESRRWSERIGCSSWRMSSSAAVREIFLPCINELWDLKVFLREGGRSINY